MYIKFQLLGSEALYIVSSIKGINKKILILSHLNDFVTCSAHFNRQSEGSISQLWNTVGR